MTAKNFWFAEAVCFRKSIRDELNILPRRWINELSLRSPNSEKQILLILSSLAGSYGFFLGLLSWFLKYLLFLGYFIDKNQIYLCTEINQEMSVKHIKSKQAYILESLLTRWILFSRAFRCFQMIFMKNCQVHTLCLINY